MNLVREHIDFQRGLASKITSTHLNYLYDPWDNAKDFKIEYPKEAYLVDLVQELEAEDVLESGDSFDWDDKEEMKEYIKKNAKGRYVYDGATGTDTAWVVFSKIKLPKADKIEFS
jgi:hypothetical protein